MRIHTQTFILNIFFFKNTTNFLMCKTLMRKNTDYTFKKTYRIILDFMGYFIKPQRMAVCHLQLKQQSISSLKQAM